MRNVMLPTPGICIPVACLLVCAACCGNKKFEPVEHEVPEEEIPEWLKVDEEPAAEKAAPQGGMYGIKPPEPVESEEASTEASPGSEAAGESEVETGSTEVKGSLEKEVIQRVIKQHVSKVRYCYEKALVDDPDIEGKVTVKFVISADGSVQSAEVAGTTLDDESVETCIVDSVKTWTFPEPEGGGIVVVSYPFIFKSA